MGESGLKVDWPKAHNWVRWPKALARELAHGTHVGELAQGDNGWASGGNQGGQWYARTARSCRTLPEHEPGAQGHGRGCGRSCLGLWGYLGSGVRSSG